MPSFHSVLVVVLLSPLWPGAPALGQLLVPQVPAIDLPGGADRQLPPIGEPVRPGALDLRLARRLATQDLIRAHPDVIDRDARGEPILRGEMLVLSPSPAALDRIRAAGFAALRVTELAGLDLRIVTVAIPAGMTPRRALRTLRRVDPKGSHDLNHIYTAAEATAPIPLLPAAASTGFAAPGAGMIGLVDGGVSASHPVLDQGAIRRHGCDGQTVASAHGTAVASLMVGRETGFSGVSPGATLYAADVYCGLPTGGNVLTLAAAFAWLAAEGVPVINVSLVGPHNLILKRIIGRLVATGHIVVAAVGNDGPSAPPLFPAAYAGVVGVTGVDATDRVLPEAVRGPQVAFAAPGAEMAAAAGTDSFAAVRGTSFAAPIVAGLLAREFRAPGPGGAAAIAGLARTAVDLGSDGPDETYGAGLVGSPYRIDPESLAIRFRPPQ